MDGKHCIDFRYNIDPESFAVFRTIVSQRRVSAAAFQTGTMPIVVSARPARRAADRAWD
ncbi:hypothetical protein [Sphingomonas sp. UYP23]